MLEEFHYENDLSGGSLMVRESRVIADLLIREATIEQWNQAISIDNLLQANTIATAQRHTRTLRKRLGCLSSDFWLMLRDGDNELATQVAFCAALESNLLLVEFMETVVRDAFVTKVERLDNYNWPDFLEERAQRDPKILEWKESTKQKIKTVVYRMLAEVGYLKSTRKLELQRVLVRAELGALLEKHNKSRLKNCMEVSR